jgi:hypothetical protein
MIKVRTRIFDNNPSMNVSKAQTNFNSVTLASLIINPNGLYIAKKRVYISIEGRTHFVKSNECFTMESFILKEMKFRNFV